VLPAGGEEYDFDPLIQPPHLPGHVHALHGGHVNIQKNQVKIAGTEIRQKGRTVHVGGNGDFHIGRIAAAFEIRLYILLSNVYIRRIVVNQSNSYHTIPSFLRMIALLLLY